MKITNHGCCVELGVGKLKSRRNFSWVAFLAQIVNNNYHSLSPYCNWHCAKHYYYIISTNSYDSLVLLPPFYVLVNRGLKKLGNLPKVTLLTESEYRALIPKLMLFIHHTASAWQITEGKDGSLPLEWSHRGELHKG